MKESVNMREMSGAEKGRTKKLIFLKVEQEHRAGLEQAINSGDLEEAQRCLLGLHLCKQQLTDLGMRYEIVIKSFVHVPPRGE
jgi:hypothetical protein